MSYSKTGRCHCGAVVFEVQLENGFESLRRCNCSFCQRRGAIMAGVPLAGLRVIKGEASLAQYQWNSKVAKHYFCKVCGIYTHHQLRSDPQQYGFNVACIDGVETLELGPVKLSDGAASSLEL